MDYLVKVWKINRKLMTVAVCCFLLTIITGNLAASDNVSFITTSDWGSGFVANITITNSSQNVSDGWRLEFDFPYNITNIWSAEIESHSGNHYVLKNVSWNAKVQPGSSVTFGFQGVPGSVKNSEFANVQLYGFGDDPGLENTPPVANNDTGTAKIDIPITISVLNNDTDADGDVLSIISVGTPSKGSVEISSESIIYTSNENIDGDDLFTYTISDGNGGEAIADVNITLQKIVNQPPTVNITEPLNNSSLEQDSLSPVLIKINTLDSDGEIASKSITVSDGQSFSNVDSTLWTPKNYGNFTITASATDNDGDNTSAVISVYITKKRSSSSLVRGWPNYISMGAVTRGIESHHVEKPVDALFKYAGDGGNGDRGSIKYPIYTKNIGSMVNSLSTQYGKNVKPVMVVYTAEMSGGTNFEDLHNYDNLTKHFINLMHTAQILQSLKTPDNQYPGSIVLNPDLLGMVQQQKLWNQIDAQPIKVQEALYRAYHFMNDKYDYNEKKLNPVEIFADMRKDAYNDWDVKLTWENYVTNNIFTILSEAPVSSIPSFNNDFKGWIQATNWVIKTFSPSVTFGWQENLWSGNSANWVHNDYSESEIQQKVSGPTSTLWNDLEVYSGEYKPDFIVFDKYERDATAAAGIGYFFNARDWDNYLTYVKLISKDLGNIPAMLWQIPGGHLQTVDGVDTREDHGSSAPNYFFGDSDLNPQLTNVKPYIINIPLTSVYKSSSDTIGEYLLENNYNWSNTNNMQKAKNSNVFSILWGGGDTTSVGLYPADDGGWLSGKVNDYYKNPTYLDGEPSDTLSANDDTVSTGFNTAATISVTNNDNYNGNVSLAVDTSPSNGSVVVNGSNIVYQPDTGFFGEDNFIYTLADENGNSDSANVYITVLNQETENYTITSSVINVGDGDYPEYVQPTGGHDVYMKGAKVTFEGAAYESLIDNNSWSPTVYPRGWKSVSGDGGGSFKGSIDPEGETTVGNGESQTFTMTPDSGNRVKDVIVDGSSVGSKKTYTFTNITANHTISVEFEAGTPSSNNPPEASNDSVSVGAGDNITINVLSNDSDKDSDTLNITSITQGAKGTAVLSNNKIIYTAYSSVSGTDTFNYSVSDGNGGIDTAEVTVTVNGSDDDDDDDVNTPPTVSIDYPLDNSVIKQSSLSSISIAISASDADGSIAYTSISVEDNRYTTSTASWLPTEFKTFTIVAAAADDKGAVRTVSISVTVQLLDPANNSKKQIIGYFSQWDAWKSTSHGFPAQGVCNQLNVDYSKYTMINFSFFGVAKDGSLHSGDYRNKQIYQDGQVQEPAPMLHGDIYSSWDYWLLYGELDLLWTINEKAITAGFTTTGDNGWTNSITGLSGKMPIPLPKEGGAPGLIKSCKDNGVKLMASIGGWSMCKHFSEMAGDPAKKQKFLDNCKKLIAMGFDGIDIDWEYPGPFGGMNFTGAEADYVKFTELMRDIRTAIGQDKLLTAAFSCSPNKLEGFEWTKLDLYMDYYNIMSYDMDGGWSANAGHNSPLYASDGKLSWNHTFTYLTKTKGILPEKINMGVGFYGRGVVTSGQAVLGAQTVKSYRNVNPDGPITTAADFTHWGAFDGTPNYAFIKQNESGWAYNWDDYAKVPYMTKENYFLSYDDETSVQHKADYVVDNNIGGVIVWHVFGDWEVGSVETTYGNKLPHCPNTVTPLLDVLYHTFDTNGSASHL